MTIMFMDSVTATNIPADTEVVGGYVNGRYAWSAADWERFPLSHHVTIDVNGTSVALCLDVESGDASPGQAPAWVEKMRFVHADPWVYCNASTWPSVISAFDNAKVPHPHYWIAQYDGVAAIPNAWMTMGCVAKQYQSTATVDESCLIPGWQELLFPVPPEVAIVLNWNMDGVNIADLLAYPTGGVVLLKTDGSILNAHGSPYFGGANGQSYFAGRTAAQLLYRPPMGTSVEAGMAQPVNGYGAGYQIVDTAGEKYNYDTSTAPK